MAKRKAARRRKAASGGRARTSARRSARRPRRKAATRRAGTKKSAARKAAPRKTRKTTQPLAPPPPPTARLGQRTKTPRLDRVRRTLEETVPTPPSSLNLDRHGSAARTGRAELEEDLREHRGMNDVRAGDLDVDVEDAFFTGEESPGGDNSTPDQDIVDDIGKALGVQYDDNEELKAGDKVSERDKHRWELDPASSEDYKDRK